MPSGSIADDGRNSYKEKSFDWKTLQKDDKARVPWIETATVSKWWSFDPGWELEKLGNWTSVGTTSITSTNERTGDYAVVLSGKLSSVAIDMVYDPWNTPAETLYPGMVSKPQPELSTWYRESGNKEGGVRLRYKYRLVDYDTGDHKDDAIVNPSWSINITTIETCNLSNFAYAHCSEYIPVGVQLSTDGQANATNNAVIFRAKFVSKTENALRLDETGLQDW